MIINGNVSSHLKSFKIFCRNINLITKKYFDEIELMLSINYCNITYIFSDKQLRTLKLKFHFKIFIISESLSKSVSITRER